MLLLSSTDQEKYAADREEFERSMFDKVTCGGELSSIDRVAARFYGWEPADLLEEIEARKSM